MFRVLFLLAILMISILTVHAEGVRPVPAPTTPIVFDKIEKSSYREIKARVGVLKIELSKDPTVAAYIINYGTKAQIKKRERQIRNALAFHKIDLTRVNIISGGDQGSLITKIYLVPRAVEPQTADTKASILDEFGRLSRAQWKKRLANVEAKFNENDATAQLVIINYGTDKEIAAAEKFIREYLGRCCHRFHEGRVTIIRGGLAKKPRRVFWIVPAGAELPKP